MTPEDHRAIAVATYNACWTLLESDRTPDQDRELLTAAFTSRYHWTQIGGLMELAVADWMVSRCAAGTSDGVLALSFARASLEHDDGGFEPWLRASLLEGLARAYEAVGDSAERDRSIAQARDVLAHEPDPDNAQAIADQLADLARA